MSETTKLWDAVARTPPNQTKPITGKPYKGTSPKPYWIVRKATETFGPCGIGWGFSIVSERVEISGKEGDKLHIAHIRLWYVWQDKRGEVEHIGQTMFSGTNRNGLYTDEDAPKKSVTDALVKALSMIGFAGDIFMGRYDDSKYVAGLEEEQRVAALAPSESYISAIKAADGHITKASLRGWWTPAREGLSGLMDADEYKRLVKHVQSRAASLPEHEQSEQNESA